jgi:enterochelin esterase family protein
LLTLQGERLQEEVEKFWDQAEKEGLPLLEKDPFDEEFIYVTLAYRDHSSEKIGFEVFGIYEETCFGDMQLRRLDHTDLWYRSYKMPRDICFSYRFILTEPQSGGKTETTDRYNHNRIPLGPVRDFSYSVLDLRPEERNWNMKRAVQTGSRLDRFEYTDQVVGKKRGINVYLPAGYDEKRKRPYPTLYLFDAFIYLNRVEVPNILDNLIAEGKIEPIVAVLFPTFRTSRDIVLPLNFRFMDEFVKAFVPIIRKKFNSSLRPEENIIGGISYGGLAAAFFSFYHPDMFGKVLSQSGSFWRGLDLLDEGGEWVRFDWLIDQYIKAPTQNLLFYLDCGLQENWVLGSNRRMARVLKSKGYRIAYSEFNGWHDWSNSRKTFPHGLLFLLQPLPFPAQQTKRPEQQDQHVPDGF